MSHRRGLGRQSTTITEWHGLNRDSNQASLFAIACACLIMILSHMTNQLRTLDRVFAALSDPTRRTMVTRLVRGPASVSELAKPLPMSLPTVFQHLKVLEQSGLVSSEKKGRIRTFRMEVKQLDTVQSWLGKQRALWEARFDRLNALLEEPDDD